MKTICNCCDDGWHSTYKDGLTHGEHFFLLNISAGGFNHLYVNDVIKSSSECLRKKVKKFLKNEVIYIKYKNKKDYGNGLFQFTKKGVEYFIEVQKKPPVNFV